MTVSIIVPHRNRCVLLERLLDSIQGLNLAPDIEVEILVVDNGSMDGSIEMASGRGARVLPLGRNVGVSRALNRGIEATRGEYIALINNDVELEPNWLRDLLTQLRDTKHWFATGKMLVRDDPRRIDGAGDAICRGGAAWRLGHGKLDGPTFAVSRRTYFPAATATVFRRGFFDRVGLFEESFFAYLEDVDLGFRAALADLPGVYVPEAVAYHRGGGTTGVWSPQMVEWLTCHQLLLLAKFYPWRLFVRFGCAILAAQLLWAALAISRGRLGGWARGLVQGLWRFASFRRRSTADAGGSAPFGRSARVRRGRDCVRAASDGLGPLLEMVLPVGASAAGGAIVTPRAAVVIVTYNSASCIGDCLRALEGQGEVWVVDNASADDTCRRVRAAVPRVGLIRNRSNRGFAAAVNQGIQASRAPLVLLMNPDVPITEQPGSADRRMRQTRRRRSSGPAEGR